MAKKSGDRTPPCFVVLPDNNYYSSGGRGHGGSDNSGSGSSGGGISVDSGNEGCDAIVLVKLPRGNNAWDILENRGRDIALLRSGYRSNRCLQLHGFAH